MGHDTKRLRTTGMEQATYREQGPVESKLHIWKVLGQIPTTQKKRNMGNKMNIVKLKCIP